MDKVFQQFTLDYFGKGKQKTSFANFFEQEDVFLLDTRSKEEAETLPIALKYHDNVQCVNMPINEVPERLAEIPQGKLIGVFCPSNIRSAMVFAFLLSKGFKDVRILEGGYAALADAVMPGKVLQAVKAAELLKD
jgi:rhodanese-related sulfurtransferase